MQRAENTAPIRQSVVVDCPIEDAFALFTDNLGDWWPLAGHSISGEGAETCVMEPRTGGRIYERTRSGEERDWGKVIAWDPPSRVAFTWHREGFVDDDQTVDVAFCVEADGTHVTVTHTVWDSGSVAMCLARFASCSAMVAV